jgi:threonine dehydratase
MTDSASLAASVFGASLEDFHAVRRRIASDIIKSPLLPVQNGSQTLRLKAECLQPLGSFKIRAAANALSMLDASQLERGVATASAGNFAQGLGLAARRRGVPLTVHVPDNAASVKITAIRDLGAKVVQHPFNEWWEIMTTRRTGADDGIFVHPVCEAAVMMGNGTVGLELYEDWPQVDTVVVPFGGGGLSCGIALALRASGSKARIVACEVETAAALQSAMKAGAPVRIERKPSFVDGIGSNGVLAEMWPIVSRLIDDVIVVSVSEVASAVRELALRHRLVAEGAGATAYAAAVSPRCTGRNVAAVISGGNIEPQKFVRILAGDQP